jgi:hypothetical protein
MPWALDPRVNLQKAKNGSAKPYQVKQLIDAIDKLTMMSAEKPSGDETPTARNSRQIQMAIFGGIYEKKR